ncbi:GNAT family N-acetyltransferase [Smaragdicoccus niigatensis]|uniref:GNAT family N-acetyltransferase n=1 Tax=Smaragdicoccus niigatensis TaxID=359359 RepID=UPI0004776067|nr:GNAT family N-acyltransferase [Smaragdicoccus niigatensis]
MSSLTVLKKSDSLQGASSPSAETRPRYSLVVSSDRAHRLAAQRLRFDVFAAEPGFAIPSNPDGLDADRFDEYCDHLLVRDDLTDSFVGCYRMLPPDAAITTGYYTATEFDIDALDPHGNRVVEMGRACVRTEHRNGTVLTMMWAGILQYMQLTGYQTIMGCVSVPMQATPEDQPGVNVRGVRDFVLGKHANDPAKRVRPYNPVIVDGRKLDDLPAPVRPALPPLMQGYLRLNAQVCGEPSHDPDFGVADFVTTLQMDQVNVRYLDRLSRAISSLEAR